MFRHHISSSVWVLAFVFSVLFVVSISAEVRLPSVFGSAMVLQTVGRRLCLAARKVVYEEDMVFSGPVFESMEITGSEVRLDFEHVGEGLTARGGGQLKGFAVAGSDRQFSWADARIEGDSVVVRSDSVSNPVAVRYAWADNPECNFYNTAGLPACPFRTDTWPGITAESR